MMMHARQSKQFKGVKMDHVGAKWYKCDFHVHTTASKCFANKDVTAQDWVNAAIERGLNCVAVTDHNTGAGIDAIVEAAKDTSLIVFPGVELTCSDAKVHLLVLFDLGKTSEFVNDFLIGCEIDRSCFSTSEAHSPCSILEVVDKAHDKGGIVIPAHIDDEFVGFNTVGHKILMNVFQHPHVRAVQTICTRENLAEKSSEKGPTKLAIENQKALLTFSDNPDITDYKKHGLESIGSRYTWIKMGETPSLEGLRQAFLLPNIRIKNDLESLESPVKGRGQWIKSIRVDGTTVTSPKRPLEIKFNPQLNTIIGGRGSGKSSIIRFLRGIFDKTADLETTKALKEILEDHQDFYQIVNTKEKTGVFITAPNTRHVVVEYVKNDILYRISTSITGQGKEKPKCTTTIEQKSGTDDVWTIIDEPEYLSLFRFEIFSQKQVYEMARDTNSLKNLIDGSDKSTDGHPGETINELKLKAESLRAEYATLASEIVGIRQTLSGEATELAKKRENDDDIAKLEESHHDDISKRVEAFSKQRSLTQSYQKKRDEIHSLFQTLVSNLEFTAINPTGFDEELGEEIAGISKRFVDGAASLRTELAELKNRYDALLDLYHSEIAGSNWEKKGQAILEEARQNKEKLEADGIDTKEIKHLFDTREKIQRELNAFNDLRTKLAEKEKDADSRREQYIVTVNEITKKRRAATERLTDGRFVLIEVRSFGDEDDLEKKLRKILGIDNNPSETYAKDMAEVVKYYKKCLESHSGNPIEAINSTVDALTAFAEGRDPAPIQLGGYTKSKLVGLDEQGRYKLRMLIPDDKIIVKYRSHEKGNFKLLGAASPGQKTAAILSVILSQGDTPLILDQPEDDLDNKIIFDLIVQGVLEGKQRRQMIIVTHNANIPVNGDAEYIVSMNSESEKISVLHCGTIEDEKVKKEICDVMEGSEEAFRRRAEKYGL